MFLIRRWKPGQPKSPWALEWGTSLERGENNLVALFTYRKGAREVLTHLMELERLRRSFAGLRLLGDMVETRRNHDRSAHP